MITCNNRSTLAIALFVLLALRPAMAADPSFAEVISATQPKMVKIYGAGGLSGLEAYQSGFLISAEGHILTVWSYVLDTDAIKVTLDDGRSFTATLLGADPRTEVAVVKIDAQDIQHFDPASAVDPPVGAAVLAFSNLFGVATGDEDASVLHGHVAAKTNLNARRGAFQSSYQGPVFVLDAVTNNPGAAGGALTDSQGRLVGLLGKELRNSFTNTWLNYAIPMTELASSIDGILSGRTMASPRDEDANRPAEPVTLELLGITLVPDVLAKTPPFIDAIRPDSPAAKAGLKPDDSIVFVNERMAASCKVLRDELTYIDRIDEVRLMVQRAEELLDIVLRVE
jgi:serine protease Do